MGDSPSDSSQAPHNRPEGDQLFADPRDQIDDFEFNADTVAVFDDMVSRSVPFYGEIQRIVGDLAADFGLPGTSLYDLGCSTGTTMLAIDGVVDSEVGFVGVDNSADMLGKAKLKLAGLEGRRRVELMEADLNTGVVIDNASVVTLVLVLQFIRPIYRQKVVQRIYDGLNPGGALILVEKITSPHSMLNRMFIEHYYEYKRRKGYSQTEISQKREALENVLIPYRYEENVAVLEEVGFSQIEEVFRWYNFCVMVAVK